MNINNTNRERYRDRNRYIERYIERDREIERDNTPMVETHVEIESRFNRSR